MGKELAEEKMERVTTVVIPQPDHLSTRTDEGRGGMCLWGGYYYTRHFFELESEPRSRDITHIISQSHIDNTPSKPSHEYEGQSETAFIPFVTFHLWHYNHHIIRPTLLRHTVDFSFA